MTSPLPDSDQPPNRDLPPPSVAALGCLFLPGCFGEVVIIIVGLWVVIQAAFWVYSLVNGQPLQWGTVEGNKLTLVWWILSAVACRALRTGKRRPWVYWITVLCLAGWCYIAFTGGVTFDYPGASVADKLRAGSWLAVTPVVLLFLWFTLSRRNLEYFRVVNAGDVKSS